MTENWYLVLELDFDPNPVNDEALIEQRIEEKRKFWSSKANDFNRGAEYKVYPAASEYQEGYDRGSQHSGGINQGCL